MRNEKKQNTTAFFVLLTTTGDRINGRPIIHGLGLVRHAATFSDVIRQTAV